MWLAITTSNDSSTKGSAPASTATGSHVGTVATAAASMPGGDVGAHQSGGAGRRSARRARWVPGPAAQVEHAALLGPVELIEDPPEEVRPRILVLVDRPTIVELAGSA